MKYLLLVLLAGCSGAPFTALSEPLVVGDDSGGILEKPAPDAGQAQDALVVLDTGPESQDAVPDVRDPPDAGTPDTGAPDTYTPPVDSGCVQLDHSNGFGQTYQDCAPLGTPGDPATYTQHMAVEAAEAWPLFQRSMLVMYCGGYVFQGVDSSGNVMSWIYSGPHAGTLQRPQDLNCAGVSWN